MPDKIKINILMANNNPNSFSFIFPILANKKRFLERGIEFSIFCSFKGSLYDCNILFVDSKFFKYWWREREEDVYDFLQKAKERIRSILWFDTSDSTGTPQFQVLPYVSGYYKNQILKDIKLYFSDFYRERIFSDYYFKKFGVTDDAETGCEYPLDSLYLDKIDVSWNAALNDHALYGNNYSLLGNAVSRLRIYLPFELKYTATFIDVNRYRKTDITARLGLTHARNFVKFHRKMLIEKLENFNVQTGFINHRRYYDELQNSKISISPFGLGEITYRDFETILCGALLIKPDMSHMKTWPDLYKDGQTYIGCDWDFSDLQEKIKLLLSDTKRMHDITIEAQRIYRYYLLGKGQIDFCDRIDRMVKRHMNLLR